MKFVNLTPHTVNIFLNNGEILSIEPSGTIARVSVTRRQIDEIDGVPVFTSEFGHIENLPTPCRDTIFIVSSLVAQRCNGRSDILIPDDSVRDKMGRILGCRALSRV